MSFWAQKMLDGSKPLMKRVEKYMSDFLIHYGTKGQTWGVRRYHNEDGTLTEEGKKHYGYYTNSDGTKDTKRLKKDAKKDAEEYARAKAYYGEGAGTRRKQIKNLISERMKDSDYKKEFETILSQQDMSKHQKAANRERKVNDTKNSIGKTARGIKNLITGVGSASIAALAIYNVAKLTGASKYISSYAKTAVSSIANVVKKSVKTASSAASHVTRNGQINWSSYMR